MVGVVNYESNDEDEQPATKKRSVAFNFEFIVT